MQTLIITTHKTDLEIMCNFEINFGIFQVNRLKTYSYLHEKWFSLWIGYHTIVRICRNQLLTARPQYERQNWYCAPISLALQGNWNIIHYCSWCLIWYFRRAILVDNDEDACNQNKELCGRKEALIYWILKT